MRKREKAANPFWPTERLEREVLRAAPIGDIPVVHVLTLEQLDRSIEVLRSSLLEGMAEIKILKQHGKDTGALRDIWDQMAVEMVKLKEQRHWTIVELETRGGR